MLAGLGFMFARPALGRSWPALPARNAPLATSCRQRLMAARFSPKGKCRLPIVEVETPPEGSLLSTGEAGNPFLHGGRRHPYRLRDAWEGPTDR